MTSLDAYMASRPDRCPGCGYHVERQGCRCDGSAGKAAALDAAAADEWDIIRAALIARRTRPGRDRARRHRVDLPAAVPSESDPGSVRSPRTGADQAVGSGRPPEGRNTHHTATSTGGPSHERTRSTQRRRGAADRGQRRAVTSHLLGALSVAVDRDEFDAALARAVEFATKYIP